MFYDVCMIVLACDLRPTKHEPAYGIRHIGEQIIRGCASAVLRVCNMIELVHAKLTHTYAATRRLSGMPVGRATVMLSVLQICWILLQKGGVLVPRKHVILADCTTASSTLLPPSRSPLPPRQNYVLGPTTKAMLMCVKKCIVFSKLASLQFSSTGGLFPSLFHTRKETDICWMEFTLIRGPLDLFWNFKNDTPNPRIPGSGLGFGWNARANLVEFSLQSIPSNSFFWKRTNCSVIIQKWSWRGKAETSARAWLREENAER